MATFDAEVDPIPKAACSSAGSFGHDPTDCQTRGANSTRLAPIVRRVALTKMEDQAQSPKAKRTDPRDVWRVLAAVLALLAVIQELRKPRDQRTWHGKVLSFVPYDFRMPTAERFQTTYWNPGGPIISGKVFGVGWAPNFGAIVSMVRDRTRD